MATTPIPVTPIPVTTACGCGTGCAPEPVRSLRVLPIVWQRLVTDAGETCERCGSTETEVRRAVATLAEALRPLGIEPRLEVRALSQADFSADPSESNRIWVAGRTLEHWVGATAGASRCSTVCGDADCRTVEIDGRAYESVPEQLVVKAGMIAAATLMP